MWSHASQWTSRNHLLDAPLHLALLWRLAGLSFILQARISLGVSSIRAQLPSEHTRCQSGGLKLPPLMAQKPVPSLGLCTDDPAANGLNDFFPTGHIGGKPHLLVLLPCLNFMHACSGKDMACGSRREAWPREQDPEGCPGLFYEGTRKRHVASVGSGILQPWLPGT